MNGVTVHVQGGVMWKVLVILHRTTQVQQHNSQRDRGFQWWGM